MLEETVRQPVQVTCNRRGHGEKNCASGEEYGKAAVQSVRNVTDSMPQIGMVESLGGGINPTRCHRLSGNQC